MSITSFVYIFVRITRSVLHSIGDKSLNPRFCAGAVAAADALQAETSARGAARSVAIEAAAAADQRRIEAKGVAESEVIRARGEAEAAVLAARGSLKSAQELSGNKVAVRSKKIHAGSYIDTYLARFPCIIVMPLTHR